MTRTDFYSPAEAAALMMCTANHVRDLIKRGQLPTYRVGSRCYIPVTAVQAYVKAQTFSVQDAQSTIGIPGYTGTKQYTKDKKGGSCDDDISGKAQ